MNCLRNQPNNRENTCAGSYRELFIYYLDSYHMPYEQWLGEVFSTFEHGKFRVIPLWEASHARNNTNGRWVL